MCLAQGPQRSDAGEARTRSPSVSSQALKLAKYQKLVCWHIYKIISLTIAQMQRQDIIVATLKKTENWFSRPIIA